MRSIRILLSLFLFTLLAGCSKDAWLQGKWVFDREYTNAQISTQTTVKKDDKSFLGNLKDAAAGMIAPLLLDKLDGATYLISKHEMILTSKDGSGKSVTYEVVDRPTKDSWLIKFSDGTVETYSREGDRLAISASGDVHFKGYFKRAQ